MKRIAQKTKNNLRRARHVRVRATVLGTAVLPRLSVFRGSRAIIAQLIDDQAGKTLCYVTSNNVETKAVEGKSTKVAQAYQVGELVAEAAKALGISQVVFDRGGYAYHGRVAAVAEGARAGGLQF